MHAAKVFWCARAAVNACRFINSSDGALRLRLLLRRLRASSSPPSPPPSSLLRPVNARGRSSVGIQGRSAGSRAAGHLEVREHHRAPGGRVGTGCGGRAAAADSGSPRSSASLLREATRGESTGRDAASPLNSGKLRKKRTSKKIKKKKTSSHPSTRRQNTSRSPEAPFT